MYYSKGHLLRKDNGQQVILPYDHSSIRVSATSQRRSIKSLHWGCRGFGSGNRDPSPKVIPRFPFPMPISISFTPWPLSPSPSTTPSFVYLSATNTFAQ